MSVAAVAAAAPLGGRVAWLQALHNPERVRDWSLADWQRVVRLARRARLLGRLALAVERAGLQAQVPEPARRHLLADVRLSTWRVRQLRWAAERIGATLADGPGPRVLLKGAAYLAQGLPVAAGRLPSDLDMLVPHAVLPEALRRLSQAGWEQPALDAHDQRYYDEWTHEVPPMRHPVIAVELDLHHAITPPVADYRVDTAQLLPAIRPTHWPGWWSLAPVDQVLHSAAHLFHDSEPRGRVRDLVDLDGLMRHFGAVEPGFWDTLGPRADALGLAVPLALALHLCGAWLQTPVPEAVWRSHGLHRLGPLGRHLLPRLLAALLPQTEPDTEAGPAQALAMAAWTLRHHWQRMPMRLLLPHAWHKWQVSRSRAGASAGSA